MSQQLRRIEAEARTKIVAPKGRGLRLTAKGEVLAGYARQVAEAMQQAENDLHRDETYVGHLRVAAIASVIRSVLGAKLTAFHREYPRVRVSAEDGETADHLDRLAAGAIDLVLAESWSPTPLRLPAGVLAQRITREALFIAVPGDHPLRSHGSLSIRDLAGERWATCARGSDAHNALEQVARRHGVELDVSFCVADHLTQLALVREGLAVACVPIPAGDSDPRVAYLPLDTELHRDILLLERAQTASLALQALKTCLVN
ncbi:DNA-binding transcriptional LysR family regulator [Nocardiopsis arvandica]|uniref:DNA-binding transcriptional LysR family regulator n=1 Tax=Nocardiopsis sinuspersici TaxID=501010 RepID=A0A7Y9XDT9_9ACTN|nr:DNA-binding transcriptional LysR family regulator [Nocardiopsis sinuspersici]